MVMRCCGAGICPRCWQPWRNEPRATRCIARCGSLSPAHDWQFRCKLPRRRRPRRQSGRPGSDLGASGGTHRGRDRPDPGPVKLARHAGHDPPGRPCPILPGVPQRGRARANGPGARGHPGRPARDRGAPGPRPEPRDGALAATPDRSRPGRRRRSGAHGRSLAAAASGDAGRDFVLAPFCEVWPDWRHPVLERTASELLSALRAAQR